MNILFITGSIERGRDGVGDYTRLIALACKTYGHNISLIALCDNNISRVEKGTLDDVQYLRLPFGLEWSKKWIEACNFIGNQKWDWCSLQFVPYSFQNRGLFNDFLAGIQKITQNKMVHILFHEIWIGQYARAPLKERIIGYFQKRLVLKLVKKLKPNKIHYTNSGAKRRLELAGIDCEYLPIFSNIKVINSTDDQWLLNKLRVSGNAIPDCDPDRFMFFGFFGSIHPNWPARQLLERLRMYTAAQSKRPVLLHAGILSRTKNRWKEIEKNYSGDWLIHSFGELPDEDISRYIQSLNFGLTSTPWDLLGKSGSVAAMVEHGIPVIVNVEGGTPKAQLIIQPAFESLILKADDQLLVKLPLAIKQRPVEDNKLFIADLFLKSLATIENQID